MAIQWFPGHMHLTRQAIAERVKAVDVVIEMLDARLPGSSANPMLAELTQAKPKLKLLSKQDLADPLQTEAWLAHYQTQDQTHAIALDAKHQAPVKTLLEACRRLAPTRGESLTKPMRVLICGIPNVGKSTLLNRMVGKTAAKAADEAGVTKQEMRYALTDAFYLYDTPGVLWPRIIVAQTGFNLAASGAIGRNAFDDIEVALVMLDYLKTHYPQSLQSRYKLGQDGKEASDPNQWDEEALLARIGKSRGGLLSGGRVDLQKAAEAAIHDFRSGALGRVSLETPQEFAQWLALGEELDAERAVRKEAFAQAKATQRKSGQKKRW